MGFKTILYIFLLIAWMIYKQYQKTKKAQESRGKKIADDTRDRTDVHNPVQVPEDRSFFEDIFTEIEPEPPQKIQKSQILIPEPVALPIEVEIKMPVRKEVLIRSDQEVLITEKEPIQKHEEFDLKKAIIYSEILKRPEY